MKIFASGELELLQMISERDTGQCVSKDAEPEGVGHRVVCQRMSPWKWWIVRSHIDWRGKRVSAKTLDPEGGGAGLWDLTLIGEGNECQRGRWDPKGSGLGDLTSIGEGNERQRRRWALKGVNCEISHRLERGTSASEDIGTRRGVDCEIPRRFERGTKHSSQECRNFSLVEVF